MKAYVLIREAPWYRREAFVSGLRAAGHEVQVKPPSRLDKQTVLVIWNRYAGNHELATQVERAGGTVLVAENGYLGAGGTSPKFDVHPVGPQPHHYYCIARGFHNDDARVVQGSALRFPLLGIALSPWRADGAHVLVCPNRAFGVPGRSMPPDWPERCADRLRRHTNRPVRVRAHPGNTAPKRSLLEDLLGAWACVVWTSSCGVHALAAGVPTYCEAPHWILRSAASKNNINCPDLPDREPHFERMSWSQWTVAEIASGEPFRHLLPTAG